MLTSDVHSPSDSRTRDRWAALSGVSAFRSPFADLDYLSDLSDAMNRKVGIVFVERDDDEAAVAFQLRSFGRWSKADPGPLTPFACIMAKSLPTDAQIHAGTGWDACLADNLPRHFDSIILPLPLSMQDVRSFQWKNWKVSPRYTYRVAMEAEGDATALWSEGTRRVYRNKESDFTLTESTDAALTISELWESAYLRHRRNPPVSGSVALRLLESGLKREDTRLFVLRRNEDSVVVAGLAVRCTGKESFYWMAGSESGPGMTVLIGKVLTILQKDGFEYLDFVGANTPSIAEFKRRFNPTLESYYVAAHSGSSVMRLFSVLNAARHRVFR
jgi:Acetyltransferase (GNAT) domain